MSKDTSGSAFPGKLTINRSNGERGPYQFGNDDFEDPGMTLRDYFAAKAMQGILSNSAKDYYEEDLSACAYQIADTMLAERAK